MTAATRADPKVSRRTVWVVVGCLFVLVVGSLRGCREYIPRGAAPIPWLMARVEGGEICRPDGSERYRVSFNDAGGMHSGNHWTWVSEYSPIGGWSVVVAGFVRPETALGELPLDVDWSDPDAVRVKFVDENYSGTPVWKSSRR